MTANGVRHFLDLTDIPKPVLAGLIDSSRAMKSARAKGQRPDCIAAGRQDARHGVRQAVNPHARLL